MPDTIIIYEKNNTIISAGIRNNRLDMLSIDADKGIYKVGNIFVGHVVKIVKHLNHAYVDIGMEKPCFLELNDCNKIYSLNYHPDNDLHVGDELLVQILKDAVGTKVTTVTTNISISSKYFVIKTSDKPGLSFSSKIKDAEFKKKVKNELNGLNIEYQITVRTNAYDQEVDFLKEELIKFVNTFNELITNGTKRVKGSLIYDSFPGYLQSIRDIDLNKYDKVTTDNPDILIKLKDFFSDETETLAKIEFYSDKVLPLDALYDMKKNLNELTKSKIWLKSGAHIVIEHTEAFTTIDVNCSKASDNKKSFEQGYYDINIEAAREIVRQLRLRNISGIIIVDFINMKGDLDIKLLKDVTEIAKSDNKLQVVDITKLGLMELTRKRLNGMLSKVIIEHRLCD